MFLAVSSISAQKIAFLVPEKTVASQTIGERLEAVLSKDFQIFDDSLAKSAADSFSGINVFNLSTEEAQNLGRAIGCDFFIVLRSGTQRRESLLKPPYYESYAVFYLVSSRTGHLIFWKNAVYETDESVKSEKELFESIENLALEIRDKLKRAAATENDKTQPAKFTELPAENSPEAANFRSPLPYRRLKPEYTPLANLYGVAATVDATVDIDEKGNVSRVEITRWAGYGLDESVEHAIRQMQWRAAERSGKPLPVRVLLRYNFRKIEKDDQ